MLFGIVAAAPAFAPVAVAFTLAPTAPAFLLARRTRGVLGGAGRSPEKVGSLDPGGIFREDVGQLEVTIGLTRTDGQWRIDELPPGVVIEKAEFFSTYAQRYEESRGQGLLDGSQSNARILVDGTPITAGHRSALTGCPIHEPKTVPRLEG